MDSSTFFFFSISILFHSYSTFFWQWLVIDGRNILDNNLNHVLFGKYRSMFIFSVCLNPIHKHRNIATMLSCKEKKNQCSFNQILCFYSRIRIHLGNRYKNFKAPILYFLNSFYFVAFFINIRKYFYPLSLPLLHYIVSFFSGTRMCIQYSKSCVYKKYISWVKSILMNKIQQCVFLAKSAIQIEMAVCMTLYDGFIL